MKKVLCSLGEGAIAVMRRGWLNAMNQIGFRCSVWDKKIKPAFDMFKEFEPDIFIVGSWELDRAVVKNIIARPNMHVMLWVPNWGDFDKEINSKEDAVLMASDESKQWIEHIQNAAPIKHCYQYYSQRWMDVTHNHWQNLGLEPIGLPLAADVIENPLTKPAEEFRCDIGFVGGYWPYKSKHLDKFLLPLCHPAINLNVKIFGYGGWPVAQHLGGLSNDEIPKLHASATICPNIFEPLATRYGFDVNERGFKILSAGGFCISQKVDSAEKDFFKHGEMVFVETPEEFFQVTYHFINKPEDRQSYIDAGIKTVYSEHTYYHRLLQWMKLNGVEEGQDKLEAVLEKL